MVIPSARVYQSNLFRRVFNAMLQIIKIFIISFDNLYTSLLFSFSLVFRLYNLCINNYRLSLIIICIFFSLILFFKSI